MRDWILLAWFIFILIWNSIDFSFKVDEDKAHVNIQTKEQKEEPKSDSPKASW